MITIVSPSVKISEYDHGAVTSAFLKIEAAGRICYKSRPKEEDTPEKFVNAKIRSGHLSIIEHVNITVKVVCDRGVTHEIVRHRIAAYSQESTRYVNYVKKGGCVFIKPRFYPEIPTGKFEDMEDLLSRSGPLTISNTLMWISSMFNSATTYELMIAGGATPQEARSVLPNSTKTEIDITYNLRQWRHFLALRSLGVSGAPHPQMKEIADMILLEFQRLFPGVFDNLDIDKRRAALVHKLAVLMPLKERVLISRSPEVLEDMVFQAQEIEGVDNV